MLMIEQLPLESGRLCLPCSPAQTPSLFAEGCAHLRRPRCTLGRSAPYSHAESRTRLSNFPK